MFISRHATLKKKTKTTKGNQKNLASDIALKKHFTARSAFEVLVVQSCERPRAGHEPGTGNGEAQEVTATAGARGGEDGSLPYFRAEENQEAPGCAAAGEQQCNADSRTPSCTGSQPYSPSKQCIYSCVY